MNATFKNGMSAAALTGVTWRKSRRSGAQGECVEVATLPSGDVAMRNSRDPEGPALIYTKAELAAFVAGAKDGEFDSFGEDDEPSARSGRSGSSAQWSHRVPDGTLDAERSRTSAEMVSHHRAIDSELQALTTTLLDGDVILDRDITERLLRVLGAAALLNRMHRVDEHGRCQVCRTKPRLRWHPSTHLDTCSVYAAFNFHVGRVLAASAEHEPPGDDNVSVSSITAHDQVGQPVSLPG